MYTQIKMSTAKTINNTNRATLRIIPHLIRNGIEVEIRHSRYMFVNDGPPVLMDMDHVSKADRKYLLARGGITDVSITFHNGSTYVGTAICSKDDNFSRSTGINLALGRALTLHKLHSENLKELARFSVGDNGAEV